VAFEWGGTFNKSQFDRLAAFARAQVADVNARITHLTAERSRVGIITFKYDKGNVVNYGASPPDSYIGKLLSAYQVLGGDPFFDMQIRQKTQPLFLARADETTNARQLSDGRVVTSEALADGPSALLVQQLTAWMSESMQYKRDALERKIRRAIDYADQLDEEIQLLSVVKQGKEVGGSVENILDQLQQLIQDRTYRAIADDKGQDPNGLKAYAPFSAYEPGPNRPSEGYERTLEGYTIPENDG
jgi:hypothetical protein